MKYVFKPYTPLLAELFCREKERIISELGSSALIEHVGSTAIPELGGKGIIDIAVVVPKKEFDTTRQSLQRLGYDFRPHRSTSEREYFKINLPGPAEEIRTYHVHMTHPESRDLKELLAFRDYLCENKEARLKYENAKKKAAEEANNNGEKYRELKNFVLQDILRLSKKASRPKVSIFIAMSLDGYIARVDNSLDWLEKIHDCNEDYGHGAFFTDIDTLILGRKSYEVITSFSKWPYQGKRTVVLSKTLQSVREEAELYSAHPEKLLSKLQDEGVRHIWIDGGITVSRFLDLGAVDFLTVTMIPILLGSGIPLFSVKNETSLKLIYYKTYESGLVQMCYRL